MITLTILFLIAIAVLLVALFFIGIVRAGALLIFGDLIVAIVVIRVLFRIFSKKEDLD